MKKLHLLLALALSAGYSYAQPFVNSHTGHVKLADVKAAYEQQKATSTPSEGRTGEDENYQFERWYNYQVHHTDANGYLVSPARTIQELNTYLDKKNLNSAQAKTTASNQASWSFFGPSKSAGGSEGIGRINTVTFHPTDTNIYWVGSAGGGAWKTTNDGQTWTAVADHWPIISISDIDLNPMNPNTMYMCTGDRDGAFQYSLGLIKSTDGGATWNTTPLTWNHGDQKLLNELIINPLDSNSMTLATSDGIQKSYDGGATWTQVEAGHFKDLLENPIDTNVLYAASFNPADIYRSDDGGATWLQVTNMSAMRIALATTPQYPNVIKAVAANYDRGLMGIYSSADTGKSFSLTMSDNSCNTNILNGDANGNVCGGQGEYDLCIAIDPSDSTNVIVGGVNTWYSIDGGASFGILNQWSSALPGINVIHADKHYLGYNPNRGVLFECNDGGIYKTSDGVIWTDITNGMGITQFYDIDIDENASFMSAGAQDNSTKLMTETDEQSVGGGDGMISYIDPVDTTIVYVSAQNGYLLKIDFNSGIEYLTGNIPGVPEGSWTTPYFINPNDHNNLLAGFKHIYSSPDQGATWAAITADTFTKNLSKLIMAHNDPQTLYAVEEYDNKVHITHDLAATWTSITAPVMQQITDIVNHPSSKDSIFVSFHGYGGEKVMSYTPATGWQSLNTGLPDVPVYCLQIDTVHDVLYAGTEIGVFYMDTATASWQMYNNSTISGKDLPYVQVRDIDVKYSTNELWIGTYGRGVWKSPKYDPLSVKDVTKERVMLTVSPNPTNGAFDIQVAGWLNNGETANIYVIDMTGKVVNRMTKKVAGSSISMQLHNLPKGNYIIEVENNSKQVRRQAKLTLY